MDKSRLLAGILSTGIVCVASCGGVDAPDQPTAQDDSALVTQTIATRDASGKVTTTIKHITRAQQQAQFEARRVRQAGGGEAPGDKVGTTAQALISEDPSCADASLWLFDGPHITGQELCLNGDWGDDASLNGFCRTWDEVNNPLTGRWQLVCVDTWSGRVRSYWAGDKPGTLRNSSAPCREYFSVLELHGTAGMCGQSADAIEFGVIF